MEDSKFLTVTEIATVLRVPNSFIYARSRKNTIPVIRVGKYLRFRREAVLQWAEAGCPEDWRSAFCEMSLKHS